LLHIAEKAVGAVVRCCYCRAAALLLQGMGIILGEQSTPHKAKRLERL
jgi:hypothetical protein